MFYSNRPNNSRVAFCRDIPSQEKIPILKVKNPESQGICINTVDFAKIPGIKIPNLGDKNPETKKNHESREFAKNLWYFQKIPKNPYSQKIVKTKNENTCLISY